MAEDWMQLCFPNDAHHQLGLHAKLKELMPEHGRVLDLGCGANHTLEDYRNGNREVWGVDFERHSQLRHSNWFRQLESDGAVPFEDNIFDVVVAVMVLEHIEHPVAFLQEVSRILRPGGHFVGHTISGSHYVTWIRRILAMVPHSWNQWLVKTLYGREEEDTFPTYYRLNRRNQMRKACQAADLEEPILRGYADPGYFRFFGPLRVTAILTDRLLASLVSDWGRLYQTVIIRKPIVSVGALSNPEEDKSGMESKRCA